MKAHQPFLSLRLNAAATIDKIQTALMHINACVGTSSLVRASWSESHEPEAPITFSDWRPVADHHPCSDYLVDVLILRRAKSAKHPRTAVKIAYLPIDLSKFDGGRH